MVAEAPCYTLFQSYHFAYRMYAGPNESVTDKDT